MAEDMIEEPQDLLARVEVAAGPDADIDYELSRLHVKAFIDAGLRASDYIPKARHDPLPYTASLDATLALVDRIFPLAEVTIIKHHSGRTQTVVRPVGVNGTLEFSLGETAPLSVCLALLRMMKAQGETK